MCSWWRQGCAAHTGTEPHLPGGCVAVPPFPCGGSSVCIWGTEEILLPSSVGQWAAPPIEFRMARPHTRESQSPAFPSVIRRGVGTLGFGMGGALRYGGVWLPDSLGWM